MYCAHFCFIELQPNYQLENKPYGIQMYDPSHLKAAFPFGYVLFRVKEDDVDLGHVEHPQRHRGRQAERDGQGGSLDIHLRERGDRGRQSHLSDFKS